MGILGGGDDWGYFRGCLLYCMECVLQEIRLGKGFGQVVKVTDIKLRDWSFIVQIIGVMGDFEVGGWQISF